VLEVCTNRPTVTVASHLHGLPFVITSVTAVSLLSVTGSRHVPHREHVIMLIAFYINYFLQGNGTSYNRSSTRFFQKTPKLIFEDAEYQAISSCSRNTRGSIISACCIGNNG
jgi:hypothetical protein